MPRLRPILHRLRGLFRRGALEAEMNAELQAHLDGLTERNIAAGMSPEAARHAAQRTFGGIAQIAEQARDERRSLWAEHLLQDVRYAARQLRRSPGFTAVVVITLALGVGVNAALFTIYNAVALRSLPVRAPDELLQTNGGYDSHGVGQSQFSYADFSEYRDRARTLSGLAAWTEANVATSTTRENYDLRIDSDSRPGRISVQLVSANYLDVLGAELQLGRGFLPEEDRGPGAHPVIVLSDVFWERNFNRDPAILGQTLPLNDTTFTVIGVTAPKFSGHQPAPPAGWVPLMMKDQLLRGKRPRPSTWMTERGEHLLQLIGRRRAGISFAQAMAELNQITAALALEFPGHTRRVRLHLEPGMKFISMPVTPRALMGGAPVLLAFGMVLLIACTNVTNLLLARGVTRRQEIGVRLALGASRGRMIRQLLTENLLLALLGSVTGVVLAVWTLQLLRPVAMAQLPALFHEKAGMRSWMFLDLGPDQRVAVFAVAAAVVVTVAAGLVPALHAAGIHVVAALKDEGATSGRPARQSALRSRLVIVQVAVCLVLLSSAGVLVRNLLKLHALDVGMQPEKVFVVAVEPVGPDAARRDLFQSDRRAEAEAMRQAVERLRSVPGIAAAAQMWRAPFLGRPRVAAIKLPDTARGPDAPPVSVNYNVVTAGAFETFGIPIVRGRAFTTREVDAGERAIVISDATARRLWPQGEALGRVISIAETAVRGEAGLSEAGAYLDYTVVGIAKDARSGWLWEPDETFIYVPLPRESTWGMPAYVRPVSASPAARAEIVRRAAEAGVKLVFHEPLTTYLIPQMLPFRGVAWVSGVLGALALLMAAVGLYGVMAFSVNQRVREIGIRMALGATAQAVIRHFVRQGLRLVGAGIAIGLVGGVLFTLLLSKLLHRFGGALDPVAFLAVTLLLGAVALLACWLPARRATKVDPMVALRAE